MATVLTTGQAIQRGFDLVRWLATEMNDVPMAATLRNRLAGGCFSIVQDHHTAVIVLLEQGLYASAFALVRSIYEAYVRGLWLFHSATDDQLAKFAAGKEPPKMAAMLEAIEQDPAYEGGTLSRIKAESWSDLCSYAHTGSLQVTRWQSETAIEQNFPREELIEVTKFSASIALLSGIGIASLAENEELALRLLERSLFEASERL